MDWIFQGNPDHFDIDSYLQDFDIVNWTVRQKYYSSSMEVGDRVFFWRASGKAKLKSGVVAVGELIEKPRVFPEDISALKYWKVSGGEGPELRVKIKILHRLPSAVIYPKADIAKDSSLSGLKILKLANQTNYKLSEIEGDYLYKGFLGFLEKACSPSFSSYSWTIEDPEHAFKILDKSVFLHHGTGIPVEIRSFFIDGQMASGESRAVVFSYAGQTYNAHLEMDNQPTPRTRLFWQSDFSNLLKQIFPHHHNLYSQNQQPESDVILRLERLSGYDSYKVSFSSSENAEAGTAWTDDELASVAEAYLWMLGQEKSGVPYSKADVNEKLRERQLVSRSKASIEYRMQNISAVLEELCLERIQGYKPAKNVGHGVRERIKKILFRKLGLELADYEPTGDEKLLAKRVAKLRSMKVVGIPRGNATPQKSTPNGTSFVRDPLVKAWVLDNSKGTCEACGEPAPFTLDDLSPFLEVHHMVPLAEDGPDVVENAVAVCPNCHRRCHLSSDRMAYMETVYSKVPRLKI